ncbi:MAG TPA: WD40 repeat domain-containing protein, partial [Hyphomicrobiales bacterium]|nr:WD40 repeat domain-containing protein [Hyphomicrobiales bacterium]
LKLWETETGREVRTFSGHSGHVFAAAFSPDGRFVLSGTADETLKLRETETGRAIRTFTDHLDAVLATFSPDGRFALSGSGDNTLKLWDLRGLI